MARRYLMVIAVVAGVSVAAMLPTRAPEARAAQYQGVASYRSPLCVALAPDGSTLYVTEHTAQALAMVSADSLELEGRVAVPPGPSGVAVSPDGARVYVACAEAGTVVVVATDSTAVEAEVRVGAYPWGLALSSDGSRLYVCNRFTDDISVVDTAELIEVARVPVVREPSFCALSEPANTLVVANSLALGSNHDPTLAAEVTFVDTQSLATKGSLRLPTGCNELAQVSCSPDGQWAYVVHLLSRFLVPTTQIERGWINTNALSVVNVATRELLATVLLDDLTVGASNPYGTCMSPDGRQLFVTIAGSHEVCVVDLPGLHRIIEETSPDKRADLANDLTFLYRNGVKKRAQCGGWTPRGIAVTPDSQRLLVANYYSGTITELGLDKLKVRRTLELGDPPVMDIVRRGEFLFHDATMCFQHWQSCASCHPDGRSDALMWDLMNDGLGNPKNAKSLLYSGQTPPVMAHGVRADMRTAVLAGFRFILFREPEEADVDAVEAYVYALEPSRSPLLDGGPEVQASIARGRALFEDMERTGCAECHPAPLYTNCETSDVGTIGKYDRRGDFDTPSLIELFRTAPYLHDGTAVTLHEVLTTRNPEDKHGRTSDLSEQELDDLVAFLLSL